MRWVRRAGPIPPPRARSTVNKSVSKKQRASKKSVNKSLDGRPVYVERAQLHKFRVRVSWQDCRLTLCPESTCPESTCLLAARGVFAVDASTSRRRRFQNGPLRWDQNVRGVRRVSPRLLPRKEHSQQQTKTQNVGEKTRAGLNEVF